MRNDLMHFGGWSSEHKQLRVDTGQTAPDDMQRQSASFSAYGNASPFNPIYTPSACSDSPDFGHFNGYTIPQTNNLLDSQMYPLPTPFTPLPMHRMVADPNGFGTSPIGTMKLGFPGTGPASPQSAKISKREVATEAVQKAARMKRRNSSKVYDCPVEGCSQTFTARHNLKCKIFSY
jgi:hypothetical protein